MEAFTVPEKRSALEDYCSECKVAAAKFMCEIRSGISKEVLLPILVKLCESFSTERVCKGILDFTLDSIMFIVRSKPNLAADHICSLVLQFMDCAADGESIYEWTVNVDPKKPILNGSKNTSVAPSNSDLTVVHITDPHYDPTYKMGSLAACQEPMCCRSDQILPENSNSSAAAGRWGHYNYCDSSLDAIVDAFTQIRRQHKSIDYIYFTGDIVNHALWDTSISGNTAAIKKVNNLLKKHFPDVPTYPVLGNHESHPLNLFAPKQVPEEHRTQWLYDLMAKEWAKWLPKEALKTVRLGGYYTVLVKPGFRIIALNNNECYIYNYWLAYEPSLPLAQLQWLHDTLLAAEVAGEKVHILGHVTLGDYGLKVCGREYNRIVERFWNTISAQFVGHTHTDEFNIFYAKDDPKQALNVMWNGGSLTTYNDVNPNYRVMTMDSKTYQINHHETWIYNMTAANLNPNKNPVWFKEYEFASEYGLKDLSPASLHNLVHKFASNEDKLRKVRVD